jgi:UDP-N-acetylmuramoylalanine--D-glutamate ligase
MNNDLGYDLKGKKVLVFGLGLLGGGIATTNWLLKQGAKVTVTDLKSAEQLKSSLDRLDGEVTLKLGGNSETDVDAADIIVLNPDVPHKNPLVQRAFSLGKIVENEATIFYKACSKPIVGITGTRGKTTTTTWVNFFLSQQFKTAIAGNSPESQFLKILPTIEPLDMVVTEVPSFHLELFDRMEKSPDIAVVTNIFQDHVPWHGSLEAYVQAKAKLFLKQNPQQHLVLNRNNQWTDFLLGLHSKAQIWFFSSKPCSEDGVYYEEGDIYFRSKGSASKVLEAKSFIKDRGEHNLENLLASALAAHLAGCSWDHIQTAIASLPEVKFRQEAIFKNSALTVINDTTATSPEGAIAACKRFSGASTILIAGGTDKDLDFSNWGVEVTRHIARGNIILLSGSATDKMVASLKERGFHEAIDFSIKESLGGCVAAGLEKAKAYPGAVLLFSPGSKSFEKFKNEFDRGEQFNTLIEEILGNAA